MSQYPGAVYPKSSFIHSTFLAGADELRPARISHRTSTAPSSSPLYPAGTDPVISFEVMPPRKPEAEASFWEAIQALNKAHPDFVSVTYGAGGQDRFNACDVVSRFVRETSITPLAHLTCVGHSNADTEAVINAYLNAHVRNFLAIRGDPPLTKTAPSENRGAIRSATELVALIHSVEAQRCHQSQAAALQASIHPLTVAVAAFPSGNPAAHTTIEQEIERLLLKQGAGADFAITQLFWDADTYLNFVDKARHAGVYIPILAGLIIPTTVRRLTKIAELTGIPSPTGLLSRLAKTTDKDTRRRIAVDAIATVAQKVLDSGAPGLHIYTHNQSRPTLGLLHALGLYAGTIA